MTSTKTDQPPKVAPWRDRLYVIIFEADTKAGKNFDIALIIAIFLSVAVVILSTLPSAAFEPYRTIFLTLEWIFTAFFSAEYILRLIIVRRPARYARSFFGIIDLLSILPAFIGLIVPGGERLLVVRTLRLLRIFRVFKLARYLSEASALRDALYVSRHKVAVFMTTVLIVVLIASAFMHVVEGTAGGNESFDSMPSAMYWAIITMTTVGYGDIVPTTVFGKMTTMILVLVGYSLIIIPTGILTAEIAGSGGTGPDTGAANTPTPPRSCPSCNSNEHDQDALHCKRCGSPLATND